MPRLIKVTKPRVPSFADQLNIQVGNEFATENQYLACGIYYDSVGMSHAARFFYARSVDHRNNALRMVRYLLRASEFAIPGIVAPTTDFSTPVAPVLIAVDRTRLGVEQINQLFSCARQNTDYAAERFLQWFIRDRSVALTTMTRLLVAVTRRAAHGEDVEERFRQENLSVSDDPSAPPIAGT